VPARAWEVADASVRGAGLDRLDARVVDVDVAGTTVTVTVAGRVHHLFAQAVPGGPEGTDVSASSAVDAADIG